MSDQQVVEATSSGGSGGHRRALNGFKFWKKGSKYRYRSIQSGRKEFRVADVLPGEESDEVHCRLRKVSLLDRPLPAYETVSYTWGGSFGLEMIQIDKYKTTIPINTAIVLRRFRQQDSIRTLFVDAICINQSDRHERSGQVAIMGEIYKNGAQNLIWLGESDLEQARLAKQAVDDVYTDMAREIDDFRNMNGVLLRQNRSLNLRHSVVSSNLNGSALKHLYSSPWFQRLWVFQEAVLSTTNSCFLGEIRISVLKVLRVAIWLLLNGLSSPSGGWISLPDNVAAAAFMWAFVDREASPQMINSKYHNCPLFRLLRLLSQFQVSEPQDFVFGLLGVYQEINKLERLSRLLQPDYSKTVVEVMRDSTLYAIQETQSFDVLCMVRHRATDQDSRDLYPSWVPKWHRPFDPQVDCVTMGSGVGTQRSNCIKSDLGSNVDYLSCLIAPGISYDIVVCLTGIIDFDALDNLGSMNSLLDEIEGLVPDAFKADGNLLNVAFALSNPVRVFSDLRNAEGGYGLLELRNDIQRHKEFPPQRHLSASGGADTETMPKPPELLLEMKEYLENRRFFTTSQGYIGTGPLTMQSGDTLSLLYGSDFPFILRETSKKQWRMIGPCNVPGVKGTEIIQKRIDEGGELELFYIW